jgi:hypothetical protein
MKGLRNPVCETKRFSRQIALSLNVVVPWKSGYPPWSRVLWIRAFDYRQPPSLAETVEAMVRLGKFVYAVPRMLAKASLMRIGAAGRSYIRSI